MIKTLGPLEDASDLASIAPVLHHWAEVISKADKQVRPCHLITVMLCAVLILSQCATTQVCGTCLNMLCAIH